MVARNDDEEKQRAIDELVALAAMLFSLAALPETRPPKIDDPDSQERDSGADATDEHSP